MGPALSIFIIRIPGLRLVSPERYSRESKYFAIREILYLYRPCYHRAVSNLCRMANS